MKEACNIDFFLYNGFEFQKAIPMGRLFYFHLMNIQPNREAKQYWNFLVLGFKPCFS